MNRCRISKQNFAFLTPVKFSVWMDEMMNNYFEIGLGANLW